MADLDQQLTENKRLTTAQIFYHMPDFAHILQEFIWQDYDIVPKYPKFRSFLEFWEHKIEGSLHSIYLAETGLITASEFKNASHLKIIH